MDWNNFIDNNKKEEGEIKVLAIIAFVIAVLFGFVIVSNAQTNAYTVSYNIVYSDVKGIYGTTEHLKADFYVPSIQPKGIMIWEHGGGFIQGAKEDGGASYCKYWAKYGYLAINLNYRLADPFSFLGVDSATATKLMWEACYRAIEDGKSAVRYAISYPSLCKVTAFTPVWFGGISAGAVAADMSVCWQPSEYCNVVDTLKWANTSNGTYPIRLVGSYSISGAIFKESDIDTTNLIMIRCYGLLDNTLKCNGGSNHKVAYEGDCVITDLQQEFGNEDYYISFPEAGHGLLGGTYTREARKFILNTIKNL